MSLSWRDARRQPSFGGFQGTSGRCIYSSFKRWGGKNYPEREREREREAMSRDENVFSLRASEGKSHRKLKTCTLSASKRRVAQMGIKSEEKHLSPHYK